MSSFRSSLLTAAAAAVKCRPLQTFHSHWFKHCAATRRWRDSLSHSMRKNKIKIFIFTWQKWCRLRIATDFRAIKIAFHILHPTDFHIATPHSSAIERFINIFFLCLNRFLFTSFRAKYFYMPFWMRSRCAWLTLAHKPIKWERKKCARAAFWYSHFCTSRASLCLCGI